MQEALASACNQDYPKIQLIAVDDGSSDESATLIKAWAEKNVLDIIINPMPLGNCKAFNLGLAKAKGKYVIDLAADDVLTPHRVAEGVKCLEAKGEAYGVHFTDAYFCDAKLTIETAFYRRNKDGTLAERPPEGFIFEHLLTRHHLLSVTMMMRKSMLDALGGYDPKLSYEDFDFWIRSSRDWAYCFSDTMGIYKRKLPQSLSTKQTRWRNKHLDTNYAVLKKAAALCRQESEFRALRKRMCYEARIALWRGRNDLFYSYLLDIFDIFRLK